MQDEASLGLLFGEGVGVSTGGSVLCREQGGLLCGPRAVWAQGC